MIERLVAAYSVLAHHRRYLPAREEGGKDGGTGKREGREEEKTEAKKTGPSSASFSLRSRLYLPLLSSFLRIDRS